VNHLEAAFSAQAVCAAICRRKIAVPLKNDVGLAEDPVTNRIRVWEKGDRVPRAGVIGTGRRRCLVGRSRISLLGLSRWFGNGSRGVLCGR